MKLSSFVITILVQVKKCLSSLIFKSSSSLLLNEDGEKEVLIP